MIVTDGCVAPFDSRREEGGASPHSPLSLHSSRPERLVILGLPWTAWLLLIIAILPAPIVALAFYRIHRADDGGPIVDASVKE